MAPRGVTDTCTPGRGQKRGQRRSPRGRAGAAPLSFAVGHMQSPLAVGTDPSRALLLPSELSALDPCFEPVATQETPPDAPSSSIAS